MRVFKFSAIAVILVSMTTVSASADTMVVVPPFDQTYSAYGRLLSECVANGCANFSALKERRALLDSAASSVETAATRLFSKDQLLAFYINAYNCLMLRTIVDRYPIKSLKEIGSDMNVKKWLVGQSSLSFDEIDVDVIHKRFLDHRAHFALSNCSVSAPPLQSEPFLPDSLSEQLDRATAEFVTSSQYNSLDPKNGIAHISMIFNWCGKEFGKKFSILGTLPGLDERQNGVINFMISQFPEAERPKYKKASYRVSYRDYDWSLSELKQ